MSEHDAMGNGLTRRLDTIERRIDALSEELGEVRAIARAQSVEPHALPPMEPTRETQRETAPPQPARPRVEPDAPPSHPPVVVPPRQEPRPSRLTAGELIERWQLLGPRGFAIVGGAVTALGIGLLFVLAANRGWIGPAERVLLGAVASALVFGAGLLVRARYGQLLAALAAVGAGTAGAYATLAAASARYDLVPDALALPLAGAIAALTTVVALAWGSQILAGIGLVGSALAPALQAIDTGMTPSSAAFAVIVLAATAVIAAKRDWEPLLATVAAIVGAQTLVFSAGVLGVLASAVLLTGIDFDAGHVAATAIAAAAGAAALAVAARRRSAGLIVSALVALLVVLGESVYDVGELAGDSDRSIGGLSMIFAAAGLLAGGFALRVLHPTPRRLGIVSGAAAIVALGWSTFGVAYLAPQNGDYEPSATMAAAPETMPSRRGVGWRTRSAKPPASSPAAAKIIDRPPIDRSLSPASSPTS